MDKLREYTTIYFIHNNSNVVTILLKNLLLLKRKKLNTKSVPGSQKASRNNSAMKSDIQNGGILT